MGAIRNGFSESTPGLRLFSSALWTAWITIFYSGDCIVIPQASAQSDTSLSFLLSTIAMGATLIIAASFPKKAEELLDCTGSRIAAALLAMAGTVGVGLAGALPGVLFVLAALLSGVGTSMLALLAARLYAELDTRRIVLTSCFSLIVGVLIYAFSTMCAAYFAAGFILGVAAVIPAVGIALASLGTVQSRILQDEASLALSPAFWRITLFCGMLVFVMSGVRAYYPQLIDTGDFSASRGMVASGLIACSALIACFAAAQKKSSDFVRFFYLLLVLPVAALAPIAIQGPGSYVSGAVGGVINGVVSMAAWALFASISSRSGMSAIRVFGFGFGTLTLTMPAGFVGGAVFGELISERFTTAVGLVFLGVFIVAALFLARERNLQECMMPTSAILSELETFTEADVSPTTPAEQAFPPTADDEEEADPSADTGTPRMGKFRLRCLEVAEEYGLSARETEVFMLLARRMEAKAIADELFVSFNTVRTHIKNIYAKLGVHNRREMQDLLDS